MLCMKCGREISDEQCFCEICLAEMDRYPVKLDTAVYLPHRAKIDSSKKSQSKRKAPSEQEQIRRLKQRIRRLWSVIGLLMVSLVIVGCVIANLIVHAGRPKTGQNYTTSTTPTAVTTAVSTETTESKEAG